MPPIETLGTPRSNSAILYARISTSGVFDVIAISFHFARIAIRRYFVPARMPIACSARHWRHSVEHPSAFRRQRAAAAKIFLARSDDDCSLPAIACSRHEPIAGRFHSKPCIAARPGMRAVFGVYDFEASHCIIKAIFITIQSLEIKPRLASAPNLPAVIASISSYQHLD